MYRWVLSREYRRVWHLPSLPAFSIFGRPRARATDSGSNTPRAAKSKFEKVRHERVKRSQSERAKGARGRPQTPRHRIIQLSHVAPTTYLGTCYSTTHIRARLSSFGGGKKERNRQSSITQQRPRATTRPYYICSTRRQSVRYRYRQYHARR